jgi:hypothetical protein
MSCLDPSPLIRDPGPPDCFIAPTPSIGELYVDKNDGKVLVYTGDQGGWSEVGNWSAANWKIVYYVFKASGTDDNVGIWSGSLDAHNLPSSWTLSQDSKFYVLDAKPITKEEYETMVAFDAIPVIEIERESPAGVLLKFPD